MNHRALMPASAGDDKIDLLDIISAYIEASCTDRPNYIYGNM